MHPSIERHKKNMHYQNNLYDVATHIELCLALYSGFLCPNVSLATVCEVNLGEESPGMRLCFCVTLLNNNTCIVSISYLYISCLQPIFPTTNLRRLRLWEEYFLRYDSTALVQRGRVHEHTESELENTTVRAHTHTHTHTHTYIHTHIHTHTHTVHFHAALC